MASLMEKREILMDFATNQLTFSMTAKTAMFIGLTHDLDLRDSGKSHFNTLFASLTQRNTNRAK